MPFWRRLAAIAQASLIEQQILHARRDPESVIDYAQRRGGHYFYMQTLAELRQEPRWLPDFIEASQLKAELMGRISLTAQVNESKIRSPELRDLALGTGENGIQKLLVFPQAYYPGPLEGAAESISPMPDEFKLGVERDLSAETLKPTSFAALANTALIFQIGPEVVGLATQALKRVKFQLRHDAPEDQSFALLGGLATVAAVTHSAELAEQVRILSRVLRRRKYSKLTAEDALRICMVASSANRGLETWCKFVGEWLTEIAFDTLDRKSAEHLRADITVLCQVEPRLWRTCAKAEAACKAVCEA